MQRIQNRFISSVIPSAKILDFKIKNEPLLTYLPNSPELFELQQGLKMVKDVEDIPIMIGKEEIRTKNLKYQAMPHSYKENVAQYYQASDNIIQKAIESAVEAQKKWDQVPINERVDIWLKAADMMSQEFRQILNAATMLGQSKTIIQAENDTAELIDFFRINAYFLKEALKYKPISEDPDVSLNTVKYRGLEGFVAAIPPFSFTAIGGNLAYTPALAGNSVLFKPSDRAVLSNWIIFKICREAGVPPGVVNFIPADASVFGNTITSSPYLTGINFTGSAQTFCNLWKQVGQNMGIYKNFPKLIGECGGKNYHFIHSSADVETVVSCSIRAAFEFCGQKCSALSRMYVPESLWEDIKQELVDEIPNLKTGDPTDVTNFMGAVIDKKAFKRMIHWIEFAKKSKELTVIAGGKYDGSKGYFIEPTVIQTTNPKHKIMQDEIFGPILPIYVYSNDEIEEIFELIECTSPYALTGSIFAQDEKFLNYAVEKLRNSAGNLYINDKSTGSVVGQQPFGGGRMSGTNEKAGGPYYILRWTSPQSIKETFIPLSEIHYPYMTAK